MRVVEGVLRLSLGVAVDVWFRKCLIKLPETIRRNAIWVKMWTQHGGFCVARGGGINHQCHPQLIGMCGGYFCYWCPYWISIAEIDYRRIWSEKRWTWTRDGWMDGFPGDLIKRFRYHIIIIAMVVMMELIRIIYIDWAADQSNNIIIGGVSSGTWIKRAKWLPI